MPSSKITIQWLKESPPILKVIRSSLRPSLLTILTMLTTALASHSLTAQQFEVMPLVGYTYSPSLSSGADASSLTASDEANVGLGFAWRESATGQGQILINHISREFTDNINQSSYSFDTTYAHFNGVALFKDRGYTTTVGIGLGATLFSSDFNKTTYPSVTAAIGTRYEFSDNLAFITELRAYATFTKDDDSLFCTADNCIAYFDGAIWLDSQVSVGLAYRF